MTEVRTESNRSRAAKVLKAAGIDSLPEDMIGKKYTLECHGYFNCLLAGSITALEYGPGEDAVYLYVTNQSISELWALDSLVIKDGTVTPEINEIMEEIPTYECSSFSLYT